jgi:hypothetical protein
MGMNIKSSPRKTTPPQGLKLRIFSDAYGTAEAMPSRSRYSQSFMNDLRAEGGCFLQEISLVDRSHVIWQREHEFAFIWHLAGERAAAQDFYRRRVGEG